MPEAPYSSARIKSVPVQLRTSSSPIPMSRVRLFTLIVRPSKYGCENDLLFLMFACENLDSPACCKFSPPRLHDRHATDRHNVPHKPSPTFYSLYSTS